MGADQDIDRIDLNGAQTGCHRMNLSGADVSRRPSGSQALRGKRDPTRLSSRKVRPVMACQYCSCYPRAMAAS